MNAILQTAAGNPENQDRDAVITAGTKDALTFGEQKVAFLPLNRTG